MDVFGLLKLRLDFIKQLHQRSCAPFAEIKQQIEDEVPPYEPPYSEDGEPPFLAEWLEADESLQVLGYSCISMLAASLQLFFKTWESEFRKPALLEMKAHFKKGWLNGYRKYFDEYLGIDFSDSPIAMIRLEEIVRARNLVQHPKDIFSNTVSFSREVERYEAERETVVVNTSLGDVPVKVKRLSGEFVDVAPEYEACREIARKKGRPLLEIMSRIQVEARNELARREASK